MTVFSTRPAGPVFRRIVDWARRRMAISRGRRILHTLSDNELKDIGLSRSSIDRVLLDGLAGRPR